jgi:hypothetical protein
MSDARWSDPREYGDRDDERPLVYDARDRDDHDPRATLMHDLDLPRGEERELVVDRDRVYELNGDDSRTLAAVGTFRVVPERDLDTDPDTLHHLREEGLVHTVDLTLAKIEHHTEAVDELNVEGILAFAERILPRASDLWVQASLEYKQRLQQLFFPEESR